ncbi:exodeoxyribonuclease VII large subunit [Clostridium frigidicarnis]|uniref:Exodeoxyribonuclease 7 large subunit n=1 Tax=Clostridium frigidicarnis TaxID=84698 RepID=A0A1I0WHF6_9CLOT|nr:exodeoxyribonuclease VII large subunit [Clostridium frigidicarnis]SFA87668.1 Exodeoxyribonuclease VII large subunit [Clostridium frigidicarnis]
MYIKTLTVSSLNSYIKRTIDSDIILNNLSIKGEVSNFKLHTSGHMYFSLKDEFAKINCVMFKDKAQLVKFDIKDGMKVEIKGRVSVYSKEGSYQLYCDNIKQEGLGDLYQAFLELKEKLKNKGLMEEEYKKPLPLYPKKVGIITSPTGAAIRDIINVARRRNKNIPILIYPALVQGISASESVIKGIKTLNKVNDVDVIIIARGGGSIEELWAFNDEKLAYEIFNSRKPIVTGIGHEVDFTIADFVSDKRCPTPSAAAEITIPSLDNMIIELSNINTVLHRKIDYLLNEKRVQIDFLKNNLEYTNPKNYLINQYEKIDRINEKLKTLALAKIDKEKNNIRTFNSLLNTNNPLNILNRGYTIVQSKKKVLTSIKDFEKPVDIDIILKDGKTSGRFIPESSL